MQLDEQDFLRLVETAKTLVFLDIEATSLHGDYGSILVAVTKRPKQAPRIYRVDFPGRDRSLVGELRDDLASADAWVTYYGKGFDIPMINTRLLRWGYEPLPKKPHLDLYFVVKHRLQTDRRSQGHLLSWLDLPERKMSVSAEVWNTVLAGGDEGRAAFDELVRRCRSDVRGLEALYRRLKPLVVRVVP